LIRNAFGCNQANSKTNGRCDLPPPPVCGGAFVKNKINSNPQFER
jgi:hypothetical protein